MKIINEPGSKTGKSKTSKSDSKLLSLFSEELSPSENEKVAFEKVFSLGNKKDVEDDLLKQMINEIDSLGEKLSRAPSVLEYDTYKNAIKKFLNKLIPGIYENEHFNGRTIIKNGIKSNKQYTVVKIINEELEGVLKYIHQKEKSNFNITDKVTRIKGLLLDILF